MTVEVLLAGASARGLRELLEYDALEPPVTRNDLEGFFGMLLATVCNASGNYKREMRPEDFFPAIKARREKALGPRTSKGKPLVESSEAAAKFAAVERRVRLEHLKRKRGG